MCDPIIISSKDSTLAYFVILMKYNPKQLIASLVLQHYITLNFADYIRDATPVEVGRSRRRFLQPPPLRTNSDRRKEIEREAFLAARFG